MLSESNGYTLPGWEPQQLLKIAKNIEFYQKMSSEQYWDNVKYFLNAVIPECEKLDIKKAIHPDDPPFSIYNLPKQINNAEKIENFLKLYDSPYNGLTLCTGALSADKNNDIRAMIRQYRNQSHSLFRCKRGKKYYRLRCKGFLRLSRHENRICRKKPYGKAYGAFIS